MSGPNLHIRTANAGGTIRRSRVVMVTAEFNVAVEMSTNLSNAAFGIALGHTRYPPGTPFDTSLVIALSGDEFPVYGSGAKGFAECGGTVTAGKLQTVTSDARIVDATWLGAGSYEGKQHNVCRAEESGTTGDLVRVEVL